MATYRLAPNVIAEDPAPSMSSIDLDRLSGSWSPFLIACVEANRRGSPDIAAFERRIDKARP